MEKTISVYDGLATVKKCFEAVGDTGRVLRDELVPALRDTIATADFVAEVDRRIHAYALANGMDPARLRAELAAGRSA